jgi:hypothetical protein
MHAHARRMAAPRCTVGVPVSQYDMAIVLLAFSVIPLDIMVADCNVRSGARFKVPPAHTQSYDFLSAKYQLILFFFKNGATPWISAVRLWAGSPLQ